MGKRYFEHYRKDLWPIIICCATLKIPDEACKKILNNQQKYFKASSTQGYAAPQVGTYIWLPCIANDVVEAHATYTYIIKSLIE